MSDQDRDRHWENDEEAKSAEDVEAHMKAEGGGRSATDDESDDVEAHMKAEGGGRS
jgi:hypothetical protein